jgi:hypothetical protein
MKTIALPSSASGAFQVHPSIRLSRGHASPTPMAAAQRAPCFFSVDEKWRSELSTKGQKDRSWAGCGAMIWARDVPYCPTHPTIEMPMDL